MKDRKHLADVRRAAILESAEALFFGEGFQKATIAQITAAAGVGLGTIYGYFSSKSAVLRSLISMRQRELNVELQTVLAGRAEEDAVHQLVRTCLTWFAHRPGLLRLVRETEFIEPGLMTEFYRNLTAQLQHAFDRAMNEGHIEQDDAEMLAWFVAGMVELVVVQTIWRGAGSSLSAENIEYATEIILRSLGITNPAR